MKYKNSEGKIIEIKAGMTHVDPLLDGIVGPSNQTLTLREFAAICVRCGFKTPAEMAVVYCCLFSESGGARGLRAFEFDHVMVNIPEDRIKRQFLAKHKLKLSILKSTTDYAFASVGSNSSVTWSRLKKMDQRMRWADVFALASVLNEAQRQTLVSTLALGIGQTLGETAKSILKFSGSYTELLVHYYTQGAPYQALASVLFIAKYMTPEVRAGKLSIMRMKYEGGPATQANSERGLAILKANAENDGYPERMGTIFASFLATMNPNFEIEKDGRKVANAVATEIKTAPKLYV